MLGSTRPLRSLPRPWLWCTSRLDIVPKITCAVHPTISTRGFVAKATEYLPTYPDYNESQTTVREAIAKICSRFPESYWLDIDNTARWPSEFQEAVAADGWLGIMMPSQYGGSELGLAEATVLSQTVAESGGGYTASSSVHMNIFGLAPVVKYGSKEQKKRFLVPLIEGRERACFAVTEPNTGLDTLKLQSFATRDGDGYILKGSKIWTSTAQVAEKILILVRTTALEDVKKPSEGLTLFYTDLDRSQVSVTEIKKMGRAVRVLKCTYPDFVEASTDPRRLLIQTRCTSTVGVCQLRIALETKATVSK